MDAHAPHFSINNPLIMDMVHHNPGEPRYRTDYTHPAVLKRMGYNSKSFFLFDSPALAITWETVHPDLFPENSPDRKWIESKRAEILLAHAECKKEGMSIYAMSDLILLPKRLIEKEEIEDTFGNPNDPRTQELLRIQIDEIFTQFPDTDGLIVRIGETYLHDAPYHQGKIENKNDPDQTILPLMQLLREQICVKHNRKLIFRTWVTFDEDLETYRYISNSVEPHPNLIIGVKHCEGDFHRATPFSRIIGEGRHPQLIEVQCAREYEGKGAYPNYITNGVIEGFEEHADMPSDRIRCLRDFAKQTPELFAGVWTWTRGGGWAGPYIKNELWCDLNASILISWIQNPSSSEAELFFLYAKNKLKLLDSDLPKFRRLCLLSAEAVIRGRNSTHGDMSPWWTRDQAIAWPGIEMWPTANHTKEGRLRNLQQKDESVEKWQEIVQLAESIQWADPETQEFAVASSLYGLHLYRIYRALVYLAEAATENQTRQITHWLTQYDQAWADYNALPDRYPTCATLYTREYERHTRNNNNAHKKVLRLRKKILNQIEKSHPPGRQQPLSQSPA